MAIAVPVACAVVAVAVIIAVTTLMLFIYKHQKRSTVPCKLELHKYCTIGTEMAIIF